MKILQAIFTLILIVLLSSCNGGKQDATQDSNCKKITVAQWGQEKYLIYLPFYLAIEKGLFKNEGLDIQIKYSGNDDQVFATVLKGEAQFGIGDPIFTAVSRERGAKGKVVASIVDGVSVWGVTRKDIKPIDKVEDLIGLKIGTFPAPSTVYTLIKNTIDDNKAKLSGTDVVQAPIGSGIALIENRSADIAMELEPGASLAESKGYRIVYSMAKFYGSFAFTGVTTTESYISSDKETVQKFVNAIEKSLQYIRANQDSTIIVAQFLFSTMDKTVISNAVKRMTDDNTIPRHASISKEGWQQAMDIRAQIGDLRTARPTESAVDNSFALNALKSK